ncbi:hypothetical protein HDU77_005100, partial [Chytriomyces hyalinus]
MNNTPAIPSAGPASSDPSDECNSTREDLPAASSARPVAETAINAPLLANSNLLTKQTPILNTETELKPPKEGTEAPAQSESYRYLLQLMLTCKMTVSVLCKDIWEHPVILSLKSFKLFWSTAVESRVLQSFPFFNMIHTIKIDASVPIGDDELFDVLERCQNLQVLDVSGNLNISSTSISQVSSSCPKLRELILARCGRVEMNVLSLRLASNNGWEPIVISPAVLVVIDFSETRLSDDDVEKITRHFSFLEQINFSKCPNLTNSSLLHIAHNCTALSKLAMSKTRVSDEGLETLCFHSRLGRVSSTRHTLAHVEFNSTQVTRQATETLFKNCNALKHVELLFANGRSLFHDKEDAVRSKVAFQELQSRLSAESGEDYPRNPDFASQFPLESLSVFGNEENLENAAFLIERSAHLQELTLEILALNLALLKFVAGSHSIKRVSAPPQMLMADAPHRFIAAQAAALDAIASVLAMGSRESAAVAESVRAAASLAANMAQTEVIVMAPASVSVGWVAQSVFTRASNQQLQLPLYNSPSLALDAWKTLISTLKAAVSNAGKALPAAANVALIAAAAAIALHVATVRLPDLRNYLEKQGAKRPASSSSTSKPQQSGSVGVDELASEVVALRAEVQRYHAIPPPASLAAEQALVPPILTHNPTHASYAELSESHIRSLEHSNALLRDSVAAMTKEIDRRSRNESALTAHLESLLARAQHETSTVTRLEHQVRILSAEKEEQRMRIESLEGHLEELRGLFGSMAVGEAKHGVE